MESILFYNILNNFLFCSKTQMILKAANRIIKKMFMNTLHKLQTKRDMCMFLKSKARELFKYPNHSNVRWITSPF